MPRVEAAHNRSADAHAKTADVHGKAARLFDLSGEPQRAKRQRVLANLARGKGVAERLRARLRHEQIAG
jgi:hypothetical protein